MSSLGLLLPAGLPLDSFSRSRTGDPTEIVRWTDGRTAGRPDHHCTQFFLGVISFSAGDVPLDSFKSFSIPVVSSASLWLFENHLDRKHRPAMLVMRVPSISMISIRK